MKMSNRSRPSPAMIVAVVALSFALGGTAVAGTDGLSEKINKSKVKRIAKKQGKKQANKAINKREASLNVNSANTANSATTAANGAAGYGEFDATGNVRSGTELNMDDLTIGGAAFIYCEDQEFKAVVATGSFTGGTINEVAAISRQSLADSGLTPADVGCPADTEWVYVTYDKDGTFRPSDFQAVGH